MHKRLIMMALLAGNLWMPQPLLATETGEMPVIAFSSKFRNVDYLFTDHAEQAALDDGASYDIAIREVGWDLISAIGRACSSIHNIEGVFVERIYFKKHHALVVSGVLADLKFLPFTEDASNNATLQALFDAFTREHITMNWLADSNGMMLSMSE